MSMNYSSILTRAWTIAWKYKILWIFGFLAMLGGGGSGWNAGSGGSNFRYSVNDGSAQIEQSNLPPEWKSFVNQLSQININTWINIIVAVGCCLLLLWVCLSVLSIIGRGGLIGGIVKADATGGVSFGDAWGTGVRYFWRLLALRLLAIVVNLVAGIILLLSGAIITVFTCGLGCIPVICGMVIIGVALRLWFRLMDYAVVVENQGVGEAIGRAWTILRDHIGPAVIVYLILLAVSLVMGFVVLILVAPGAALIFLSFLPLITQAGSLNVPLLVIGIVLLVIFTLVSLLINAVYTVWETGVWTFAYQAMIGQQQSMIVAGGDTPPAVNPAP
jgi:hypothetical protein